jgi:hypothetical protein
MRNDGPVKGKRKEGGATKRVNTPVFPFRRDSRIVRSSHHMSKRKARDATEEMGAAVDSCKAQRSADVDTDERLEAHMLSLCQQRGTEKTC